MSDRTAQSRDFENPRRSGTGVVCRAKLSLKLNDLADCSLLH